MTPELLNEIRRTLEFSYDGTDSLRENQKRIQILEYAKKYDCRTLIETGTNRGDTVEAVRDSFRDVYSIEIGPNLYKAAQRRFINAQNVHLRLGDAREVLPNLLSDLILGRVIFYLDAHFQYDDDSPAGKATETSTPVEIDVISQLRPGSLVLIDDARLFSSKYYPSEPDLLTLIQQIEDKEIWDVELKDDMIRLVPKSWAS